MAIIVIIGTREGEGLSGGPPSFFPTPAFIDGRGGNDTIFGTGSGNIVFGGGADTLLGGAGDDRITGHFPFSAGVTPGGTFSTVRNDGPDLMIGGAGDDTLYGAGGADTILGGPGDDVLEGSFQVDLLSGGPGADRFVFRSEFTIFVPAGTSVVLGRATFNPTGSGEGNRDVVVDFEPGRDVLDLSAFAGREVTTRAEGDNTIVEIAGVGEIELLGVAHLGPHDIDLIA